MKHITLVAFLLIISTSLLAQQASLDCIEVNDLNGSVELSFSCPLSAAEYRIHRAEHIGSDHTYVGTASGGTSNIFIDVSVNGAAQHYSYFVEAIINGQGTGQSNRMQSILLNTTDLLNGFVDINWNDPGFTPSSQYEIWRRKNNEFYQMISTTNETFYQDSLESCDVQYLYQIRLNTGSCISKSNLKGGFFSDITAPTQIIPKNATIDTATGEIILSWFLPLEENLDIEKYQVWIIDENGGSASTPEYEIDGFYNLSVRISNSLACDTSLTFALTAEDNCGNAGVYNNEDFYIRTLNLHPPTYNICNDECVISWDSVFAWQDDAVKGIRVFRKEDNNEFELLEDFVGTETKIHTYGYERGVKYEFYIEAYSENNLRVSTSCIKSIVGKKPVSPKYTWLRYASVEDGEVHLKWQVDSAAVIPSFAISRSDGGEFYSNIDTVFGYNDTIYTYIDLSSKYYKRSQHYKIIPFDSCMNSSDPSNHAATIFTTVESHSDGKALITWTPYELMDELEHYNVYRIIDSLVYYYPIATIYPEEELEYIDDYSLAVSLLAKVGYFVEAVGKVVDSLPVQDTARSNSNFIAKVSNLFVPTGFRPQGGITEIFKPIYTGVKLINYKFRILNRWGQVVFETHQPTLGWDGTFLGDYVAPGAFVYVVEYETIYAKQKRQSGMLIVL